MALQNRILNNSGIIFRLLHEMQISFKNADNQKRRGFTDVETA
ncbi:hypothetical protein EVA_20479 [gut metagenome]|uniref:Uncharacterized protein n=1 Tax=gut metagenome TaxID=749906 RepID=J9FAF1_9ZZZZ